MARKATAAPFPSRRRQFTDEFRRDAVQMMLDGHTAASVAERLGLSGVTLLYRWKQQQLRRSGPVAVLARRAGPRTRSRTAPRRAGARHPKKSVGHFRPQRVTDVYAAVEAIARDAAFPSPSLRRARRQPLRLLRLARRRAGRANARSPCSPRPSAPIFWRHRRRYGARRIAAELADHGDRLQSATQSRKS